ncbi:GSCOCT00013988001.2-RA-CDS [Cotesia congregata]|uniref:CYP6JT1PARTIAL n=1 Tax=Cotesia congregata TaxID=51543 RepID=A0A8J2MPZ5_COTCN|nr:GSCOCT00013988001.2-RA-CDS [Cotesia congregata]CAG5100972.1 CYP6JT1PARTIAL [Cotesia congregata]
MIKNSLFFYLLVMAQETV